jgi:hypothetical protein
VDELHDEPACGVCGVRAVGWKEGQESKSHPVLKKRDKGGAPAMEKAQQDLEMRWSWTVRAV